MLYVGKSSHCYLATTGKPEVEGFRDLVVECGSLIGQSVAKNVCYDCDSYLTYCLLSSFRTSAA